MNADGKFVILITAGRCIRDPDPIERVFRKYVEEYGAENIIFRHGAAVGGDCIGAFVMRRLGVKNIQARPVLSEEYLAFGKGAPNKRNERMLDEDPIPDIVLAFPDENSKGTYNAIDAAINRDIGVRVYFDYLLPDNPKRIKYWFYHAD